jgi:type I restriction enzyme M protein
VNTQSFDSYDFKAEIETKEQIRPLVESSLEQIKGVKGNTESDQSEQASATAAHNESAPAAALVIGQLERWWDKYHVSLHQLDAEVATAEQVMQGYLKELGYE